LVIGIVGGDVVGGGVGVGVVDSGGFGGVCGRVVGVCGGGGGGDSNVSVGVGVGVFIVVGGGFCVVDGGGGDVGVGAGGVHYLCIQRTSKQQ
jgi:hypothetical protein